MTVTGQAADSATAARIMRKMDVGAIVVLGGDGTHRVVISECGNIPIAGVSTGTNNAFPKMHEPTVTGLAAGLAVTGAIPAAVAYADNKRLDVAINDRHEIALVDVAIVREQFVGSRAVWKADGFRELFVAFGEPGNIGLSSIAGLIAPVSRTSPFGRRIIFEDPEVAPFRVAAPIAPGLIENIGIARVETLDFDTPTSLTVGSGSIALDGEREITFSERDRIRRDAARSRLSHHRRTGVHGLCGQQRAVRRNHQASSNRKPVYWEDKDDQEPVSAAEGAAAGSLSHHADDPGVRRAAAHRLRARRHSRLRPSVCRRGGLCRRHHDAPHRQGPDRLHPPRARPLHRQGRGT